MKFQNLSVKRLFGRVAMELVLSMSGITIALFLVTKQIAVLLTGGALLLCAIVGIFVLTQAFGKRLSQFTTDLCQTLDHMIAGNEAPQRPEDSETQLARIGHRLARLYQIMQENRRRVDEERQELQTLVSDISHQVKTPVSNLKMATDTLLEKPMTEAERTDFIRGIRSQTDKLDFLFQALVKTSRLETGVIQLDKKPGRLFDTVAQAMSGIVYAAEKKEIAVSVDCPEDLTVYEKNKKGESYCKTNNVIKKEKLLLKRNHRLTNIRKNYLNQTTSEIVSRKPRFICIEDLNVSGMMKNRHLSKAVQNQGFFEFRKQLEHKCRDKGIQLIVADRFYPSSKLCSCCGNIKKDLKLSDRIYKCDCGNVIDRDFQASINLKAYGERVAS